MRHNILTTVIKLIFLLVVDQMPIQSIYGGTLKANLLKLLLCFPAIADEFINNIFHKYCQALSISQSLNLSLSLRDRDRADTIITLYHTTHRKLFKHLEMTYSQV